MISREQKKRMIYTTQRSDKDFRFDEGPKREEKNGIKKQKELIEVHGELYY